MGHQWNSEETMYHHWERALYGVRTGIYPKMIDYYCKNLMKIKTENNRISDTAKGRVNITI